MARSIEQAFESLGSKIERLPSSKTRTALEIEHAYAERWLDVPAYRALRSRVTNARFEFARADLAAIKTELASQGGLFEWNQSPWVDRLTKWLLGYEASGFDTVSAFFDEASDIAEELDRRVRAARPRYSPRPTMERTGKTAREAKKRARHLKNQATSAETNRGHVKGLSPGVDKRGKRSKDGKRGKKK